MGKNVLYPKLINLFIIYIYKYIYKHKFRRKVHSRDERKKRYSNEIL